MGSRIVHYCIADKISRSIEVDRNKFLLGSLVADIPQLQDKPKKETHFINMKSELKHDYREFYEKYKSKLKDSFFLGYYSHLISDELWNNKIFIKHYGRVYPGKENLKEYYYDFFKLNGRLIEYYKLENDVSSDIVEIDEVDERMIPTFLKAIHTDFEYSKELLAEPLKVLTLEEVIECIEEAVEMSLCEFEKILK